MNSNNRAAKVDPHLVPLPEDAVRQYEEAGGHLTHFSKFGEDPFASNACLIRQREEEFQKRYPSFDPFFSNLVNGNDSLFREGLLYFIRLTHTLQQVTIP